MRKLANFPTIDNIRHALSRPLPGKAGQSKMAPQPLPGQADRWHKPDDCREAGVLLMLYTAYKTGLHIALIRRNEYPGVHSGQISFPGGRREKAEMLQTTALRETMEEIGVKPESLEIIGQLSPLYIPPSNFCVYPFVAFSPEPPIFQLDPKEVAELLEIPLDVLLNPASRKKELRHIQNHSSRHVPFFDIFGHKVWGATAMILAEFITLLDRW